MPSRHLSLVRKLIPVFVLGGVLLAAPFVRAETTIESRVCQSNTISLATPINGKRVTAQSIEVSGHSTVGAKITIVRNGTTAINTSVLSDGSFSAELPLSSGANHITAVSRLCEQTLQSKTVTVTRARQNFTFLWLGLLLLIVVFVLRRRRKASQKEGSRV